LTVSLLGCEAAAVIAMLNRVRPGVVPVLTALSAAALLVVLIGQAGHLALGVDSTVYRAGALAVAHGQSPYGPLPEDPTRLPFTYPPVAALLFLPLAGLSPQAAWGVFAVLSVLSTGLLVGSTLRAAAPGLLPYAGVLIAGSFALEPVWRTVSYGQINLLLAALVVLDVLWLKGSRRCGVLIGLAAAVKLTPLVFVPYLLLTGRRADAARATGAFLAVNAVTALVLPDASGTFWGTEVFSGNDATVNAWVGNQSLNGTAVSPIAWTHHWVWVLPALLVLAGAGHRAATGALAAAGAGREVWWLPGPAAALTYPALGAALILLLGADHAPEPHTAARTAEPRPARLTAG
jgi:alpha-1,2-mannosyltransferase